MATYTVVCPQCQRELAPCYLPACPDHAGLVQIRYEAILPAAAARQGAARALDWMPCAYLPGGGGPVTLRTPRLAHEVGLEDLIVSFNGYWPEQGGACRSGTFKEYEALVTLQRLREFGHSRLVLASAGNTGRAFAQLFQRSGVQLILVVPQSQLHSIWLCDPPDEDSLILLGVAEGDYLAAIQLAERICRLTGFQPEGGARSIARRAALALPVVEAVMTQALIPEHYVQAVGSGTGGIAAHEAALRFGAAGTFPRQGMRLHLAQNEPFTPMVKAFQRGSRTIDPVQDGGLACEAMATWATMLTNRQPPYGVAGGVYDVLKASGGMMWGVSQDEARSAQACFERFEGIDIEPEGGVALAALRQAVQRGQIGRHDTVLLNITGGGVGRLRASQPVHQAPFQTVAPDCSDRELLARVAPDQTRGG